jgi:mono/diheme cytochrome c family protein
VFKRNGMIVLAVGVLILVLSACGSGELAKDLTPIPTLPKGQEPALLDSLNGGAAGGGADALVAQGQQLFTANCAGCHQADDSQTAPGFSHMADRAPGRVAGVLAEDYLRQSIRAPGAFTVPDYTPIMPPYDSLSEDQVNALVAYLMSLGTGTPAVSTATEEPAPAATEGIVPTEEAAALAATEEATPAATEEITAPTATEEAAAPVGDAKNGETLFASEGCSGCHTTDAKSFGPPLTGMGERAQTHGADRDLSAADYLHESIVDPGAYIVKDYSDAMPKEYGKELNADQIADLVAYLLTQ